MRRSMKVMWDCVAVGSCFLLIPAMVQAQGRGTAPAMTTMARPMVAAPNAAAHTGQFAVAHGSSGTRTVTHGVPGRMRIGGGPVRVVRRTHRVRSGTTFSQGFAEDEFDAPGLGFDAVHFAAIHPHDRDRRRHRGDFAAFFPFFDGGFFLPSAPVVIEDAGGEGQPEESSEGDAPEAAQHLRTHAREREQMEAPVISRDVAPEPPGKTEEYVFVRRDGTLFFAIAYSWDNGTLRYITTEGLRRSATRESLDLDATQQFNEQRGMSFRVPA